MQWRSGEILKYCYYNMTEKRYVSKRTTSFRLPRHSESGPYHIKCALGPHVHPNGVLIRSHFCTVHPHDIHTQHTTAQYHWKKLPLFSHHIPKYQLVLIAFTYHKLP